MRAALAPLLAAVFVVAASSSHAAPPAAPSVTVGADIKEFVFDWDAMAGASFYAQPIREITIQWVSCAPMNSILCGVI